MRPGQRMRGGTATVAPEARSGDTLVANGRNWSSSFIGSSNNWLITGNWKVNQGREFSNDELTAGGAICLIGKTVRRELFGSRPALGEQLRVKQVSCTIVGLLASKGQGAFGNDQDVPRRPPWRRSRSLPAPITRHTDAAGGGNKQSSWSSNWRLPQAQRLRVKYKNR